MAATWRTAWNSFALTILRIARSFALGRSARTSPTTWKSTNRQAKTSPALPTPAANGMLRFCPRACRVPNGNHAGELYERLVLRFVSPTGERGRLFSLETDPPVWSSNARATEYFWLCAHCSTGMTLSLTQDGGVMATGLSDELRNCPPATLNSVDRENRLFLRSVSFLRRAHPKGT